MIIFCSNKLMLDPQVTSCGHTFCMTCVDKIINSNTKHCALCRQAVTASVVNVTLRNLILEHTQVSCTQCDIAIMLSDCDKHKCPEEIITFNLCSESMKRRAHALHSAVCTKRKLNCVKCGKHYYAMEEQLHMKSCKNAPHQCPLCKEMVTWYVLKYALILNTENRVYIDEYIVEIRQYYAILSQMHHTFCCPQTADFTEKRNISFQIEQNTGY